MAFGQAHGSAGGRKATVLLGKRHLTEAIVSPSIQKGKAAEVRKVICVSRCVCMRSRGFFFSINSDSLLIIAYFRHKCQPDIGKYKKEIKAYFLKRIVLFLFFIFWLIKRKRCPEPLLSILCRSVFRPLGYFWRKAISEYTKSSTSLLPGHVVPTSLLMH